jgi:2-phosphosulfolactate phosphatase
MAARDRTDVYVHLLPDLIPPGALRGGVAVVVDVLRASTVMIHALASGAAAVIPCLEVDEARQTKARLPTGSALLAGERHGRPIEGFDLSNSPAEFTPDVCRGKTIVLTTTNGTRGVLACLEAEEVLVAAFVNRRATARWVAKWSDRAPGRSVHIVCSGTERFISLEDSLFAGALVTELTVPGGPAPANDEALIVEAAWRGMAATPGGLSLAETLARGRGGRNVLSIGLPGDIADAARVDRFDLVAVLRRDPLRIVAAR